jgi:TonB family protein
MKQNGLSMLYFVVSCVLHVSFCLFFMLSFDKNSPLPVVQNDDTDKQIISASLVTLPPSVQVVDVIHPPVPVVTPVSVDAIPIKKVEKKVAEKPKPKPKMVVPKIFQPAAIADEFAKELKQHPLKPSKATLLKSDKSVKETQMHGEINKFTALILQAISAQWLVPSGVNKNLSTTLLIRLAPGGLVLDVQITKSSGNHALDYSARDAVLKASPLPTPKDRESFDQFRQFQLKVKPLTLSSLN